jgi:hypothetical protein
VEKRLGGRGDLPDSCSARMPEEDVAKAVSPSGAATAKRAAELSRPGGFRSACRNLRSWVARGGARLVFPAVAVLAACLLVACAEAGEITGDEADLYPFQTGGPTGYVDATGAMVIEPIPQCKGQRFSEGLAVAYKIDVNRYGFLDRSGAFAIEPQFADAWLFSEGLAAAKSDTSGWGYIDKTGAWAIDPQFSEALPFHDGLGPVRMGDLWGYVDKSGKMAIEPQFSLPGSFVEGLAVVQVDGKFGFIDEKGIMVITPQFQEADPFSEGLAAVVKDGRFAYIDQAGDVVIDASEYTFREFFSHFSEGFAAVAVEDGSGGVKCGFIDRTGKLIVQPQFDYVLPFSEGLAMVVPDGTTRNCGYIDTTGAVVIAAQFENGGSFLPGGVALVNQNAAATSGEYIDKSGKIVFQWGSSNE